MKTIPLIIHQIYEGRDGTKPDDMMVRWAKTWVENHPDYEYWFWDYKKIDKFLLRHFPHLTNVIMKFKYNVQRWDAIRYLILFHYGGVYADLDYECTRPIDKLIQDKQCCFGMEPELHCKKHFKEYIVGNALMATIPNHPFFKEIIRTFTKIKSKKKEKFQHVLKTTGPLMLTDLYKTYAEKESITLLKPELVAPFAIPEIRKITNGSNSKEMVEKKEKAYAIHYFIGSWLK